MPAIPIGAVAMPVALAAFLLAAAGPADGAAQESPACEIERPIVFAGLDYDSAAFHTAVAQLILSKGYGCKVDRVPGQTIPLLHGLARGDVDVVMEIWTANPAQPWLDALAEGKVVSLGVNFPDATEGWFVPRYVVEGPNAPAPGLKSVQDLPRYKDVFRDPEEPSKGRFYNCVPGWQCELVNSKKLAAYGLSEHFTNFRPGSGEALAAAIESNVKRERPILFYYWGPTWLLGKYDFVKLEEPPFDKATWQAMMESDSPSAATAYPVSQVIIGANLRFANEAPRAADFLKAYETDSALVSRMLAHMRDTNSSAESAARHFLATEEPLWSKWVPPEVAARVRSSL